jgi:lysophospholipase L1-like esterase
MRKRSTVSVLMTALGAASIAAFGLVAAPSVSQATGSAPTSFYLSLGDSYSVGYQPGKGATAGYTTIVATKAKLQLENFGCGGATSGSLLTAIGCTESGYGPVASIDAVHYPTETQEQGALDFIAAHPGKVGLITVSIGGNDITGCASAGSTSAIETCVAANAATVKTNVTALGTNLRNALTAAGDSTKVPIIGLTYPDVILGDYVWPKTSPDPALAKLSVTAFKGIVNPDLKGAYTSSAVGGAFVDVTAATDAYKSLTMLVTLTPYGRIPLAVAKVCELTYYCSQGNIHANTTGYTLIGNLVATEYAHLRAA